MSARIYYLKAFTPEDCDSWYTHIKNKQVFGVPLDLQELGPNGIPYVMDKCLDYIEKNASTDIKTLTQQGIYRLSGSQLMINKLKMLFNQDATKVRISIDEYFDVHAVTGLLKLYLRELPEPLLTNNLRMHFIANTSDQIEYNEKFYTYKDLIKMLPEINRLCLRALVLHLNLVIRLEKWNKMHVDNVVLLFGPIIASCASTIEQSTLNKEYAVLKDLLSCYDWIFDIPETELKSQQAIIDFITHTQALEGTGKSVITTMQIPIWVENTEDQMKMDSETRPYDVCLFAIKKYDLPHTVDWALFQVNSAGCFERPVSSKEKVMELAMSLSDTGKLVVKENVLAKKLDQHDKNVLVRQGYLNYSVKGDKWKKQYFVEIKNGNIRISSKKDSKEEENLSIHELVLYVGVVERKPVGKYGFMVKLKPSNSKDGDHRYFSSDNEFDVYGFIAAILNIKYPTGIWAERCSQDLTQDEEESRRFSQFWGRQSTILQPQGASHGLVEQLQGKRRTLRKFIRR